MPTILEGVTDSISTFLNAKLPEPPAEGTDLASIQGEVNDLKAKLERERDSSQTLWSNSQKVNKFYQYVAADAKSLVAEGASFRKVVADKNKYLADQLAKLEEPAVSGLGQSLIDCSQKTGVMAKNFQNISKILDSLKGDLGTSSERDYAYDQLCEELKAMDETEAKDSETTPKKEETYIGRLNAFDPGAAKTKLKDLKENIRNLYKSLINISIDYQNVVPRFDRLKVIQGELAESITALEADLTAASEAAVTKAAEDLAALEKKKEELRQINLLETFKNVSEEAKKLLAKKTAESAEEATDSGGDGNEETKPKEGPLADIDKKIEKAREILEANKETKAVHEENVERLKAVLKVKSDFNGQLDVHLKALKSTRGVGVDVREKIDELYGCLDGMVKALNDLQKKMPEPPKPENKKGTGSIITSGFLKELENLTTIRGQITKLNEGISKVKAEGDIKVYFNEIITILDGFPEPVKSIADNSILIEHTLTDLREWADLLKTNVGEALQTTFAASTFDFGPGPGPEPPTEEKGGKPSTEKKEKKSKAPAPKHRIDKLIADLVGQVKTDDDLDFPEEKMLTLWKDKFGEPPSTEDGGLADWKAHFEQKLADIKIDDGVQTEKIEFLSKLSSEPAKA